MSHLPGGYGRWLTSHQLTNLPQAMAPIALTLATVSMRQDFNVGAALVTAMSFSQVVFAVPLGRLGDRVGARAFLRYTLLVRAGLVFALAAGIAVRLDPYVLIALAAASGAPTGAIFGAYRALLSEIVPAERLPRALTIGATAGELVFVGGPVLAAAVGGTWPVASVVAMAVALLAAVPLLPRAHTTRGVSRARQRGGSIPLLFVAWMTCALATSSAVALVEVGAVTIAVELGLQPRFAAVFAVSLCIASVTGGLLATWRNPPSRAPLVVAMLATTVAGVVCIRVADQVGIAIVGAVLVGLFLAPLMTYYSLSAEALLPPERRTEGFSWLRISNGVGLAATSLAITVMPIGSAALIIVGLLLIALVTAPLAGRRSRRYAESQHRDVIKV